MKKANKSIKTSACLLLFVAGSYGNKFTMAAFVSQNKPFFSSSTPLFYKSSSESSRFSGDKIDIIAPKILNEQIEFHNSNSEKSLATTLKVESLDIKRERPIVVGHRGSLYKKLENTRASFNEAANAGCDYVELDVFLLKCNTLVVFHGGGSDDQPGLLDDYCGVPGSILDYSAEEARSHLKFNPHYAEFGCGEEFMLSQEALEENYIPTLEEVLLDAKKSGIKLKIELKGPGTALPVIEMVDKLGMVNQCEFSSFDHEQIKVVRELKPNLTDDGKHVYKTGALFGSQVPDNFIDLALSAGASEVHLKYDTCTTDRIQKIHNAGMGSMAWIRGPIGMKKDVEQKYLDVGNEDEKMYLTLMATGVESMCVNRPDLLVSMIHSKNGMNAKTEGENILIAQ